MNNNFESKEEILIHKLAKLFFSGCHKFNLDLFEIEALNWSVQEKVLNVTINNDLVKTYPVSNEFCRLYFKNLLMCIESSQEVHEGIYEIMCHIMQNKCNNFCYKHYVIEDNLSKIITIKETRNMVINGTTGMKTWEAAVLLTDWIFSNQDLFKNKRILELGSGVGFTGISVTKYCDVLSMTLTDCHEDVLNSINSNIKINFPDSRTHYNDGITVYKINNKIMRVFMLDWNYIHEIKFEDIPDIIIGADIVYDPSILEPLCKVLQIFFTKNKSLNVFIACVIRNENTFHQFFQVLRVYDMLGEKLKVTNNVHLEWDPQINNCIVKIKYIG